jgi:hypothetical protein
LLGQANQELDGKNNEKQRTSGTTKLGDSIRLRLQGSDLRILVGRRTCLAIRGSDIDRGVENFNACISDRLKRVHLLTIVAILGGVEEIFSR